VIFVISLCLWVVTTWYHYEFYCCVSLECGEVYGRLFDHKPVVRGEVNFFLREFEVGSNVNHYC